jgi:catechol 2,3-dioxygenase-like lactoylglutathione lyase family enzyme
MASTMAAATPTAEVEMSVQAGTDSAADAPRDSIANMKLEVVVLPVSDVGRAKNFYEKLGWRLDADFATGEDFRVVQLTPPGSQASIIFGSGITSAPPGSTDGLQLTVSDIDAIRKELLGHGVEVSEVFHDVGGVFHHAGTDGRVPGPAPKHADYGSFASFSDPDGNGWVLQEINTRLPGRVTGATFESAADLQQALVRAEAAHGKHERQTGEADAEWPRWYARYMVAEQTGQELPS